MFLRIIFQYLKTYGSNFLNFWIIIIICINSYFKTILVVKAAIGVGKNDFFSKYCVNHANNILPTL